MADSNIYDLVVIGGGPAGYAAAIRAGQLGKKVACVEMERAGGTCLNWGCIPSKALLKSAEVYNTIKHAEDFGLSVDGVGFDFAKIMKRSRGVADTMGKGIEFLFKKNKVDYFVGKGFLSAPGMVEVTDSEGKVKQIPTDKVLLATGCKARALPGMDVDGKHIMTSREALAMTKMPKSIVIMGAGAIGVEFAYFLNSFGCDVTLVEMLPKILPVEDADTSAVVERSFKKSGIKVHVNTKVDDIKVSKGSVSMNLVKGDKSESVTAETLLMAIGVVANTDGLLADNIELAKDRGFLIVDNNYQTSLAGVYAAGDIVGPPWLAHVATYRAIHAVNGMFGAGKPVPFNEFPGCTYCQPQVASIGVTEEKAKELGLDYKVGKFPFSASGKAVAVNHPEGFVKLIVGAEHGDILGAHIVGSDATELITEYALGMKLEATIEDIHATIHAHPTMSEALAEAAADVHNEAIHI
jgi:dihydrolipoamide dehydrogenase